MDCRDEEARILYRVAAMLEKLDPAIAGYLRDLARAIQANDGKAFLMTRRQIEQYVERSGIDS
jgi:hypothetical protein